MDRVSRGMHVEMLGQHFERLLFTFGAYPLHLALAQRRRHRFRQVDDLREALVYSVAFGLQLDVVPQELHHIGKLVLTFSQPAVVHPKGRPQPHLVEGQSASSVLFLGKPNQVGGVGQLRLHFLFTIPKIVVSQDRHHDALLCAMANLECSAIVVQLVLLLPTHPVSLLSVSGLGNVWQTHSLLREAFNVGCQDDAASGTGPALHIQRRVVDGEAGVPPVAEDVFNEIQVADQRPRHEESVLHALHWRVPWHLRDSHWPQQQ
mmetsp:Transcript_45215/g.76160  ORF Transcript_45215/g.76160 Transcript_45215/m.76160 type:complete len:262 (+) Transcript_45215:2517-3302(+)